MRRFRDPRGLLWDAVVSRESWGTLFALFVPSGSGRPDAIRRALLASEGYDQAQRELDTITEDELLALFERSEPDSTPQS